MHLLRSSAPDCRFGTIPAPGPAPDCRFGMNMAHWGKAPCTRLQVWHDLKGKNSPFSCQIANLVQKIVPNRESGARRSGRRAFFMPNRVFGAAAARLSTPARAVQPCKTARAGGGGKAPPRILQMRTCRRRFRTWEKGYPNASGGLRFNLSIIGR